MKDVLKVYVPLGLLALVLVVVMMRFVSPAPPRQIVFAAGSIDGQYYRLAKIYQDRLAVHGIEVEILETAGTIENYARLDAGEADVAFLQGGLAAAAGDTQAQSLGGMFAEPYWIFVRSDLAIGTFGDLRSVRLAAGPVGSGTRTLTEQLQADWGGDWGDLIALGGNSAATALINGQVDAAVFAASVNAPYVEQLLGDPSVLLLAVRRAQALSMIYPSLVPATLYEGVVDLQANQPTTDISMVVAIAQLGVRDGLHPAIQSVLIETAEPIHGEGSILTRAGQFPDPVAVDLPLSDEARRYYRNGPTFLRRYFSFSTANFLERAWVFLIPLITLLIPLMQVAPPVYRWRIRRKIYVWYDDLHDLEQRGLAADNIASRQRVLDEIQALQHEVGQVDVPVSYNDELYHLRGHINFVEALIARQRARET